MAYDKYGNPIPTKATVTTRSGKLYTDRVAPSVRTPQERRGEASLYTKAAIDSRIAKDQASGGMTGSGRLRPTVSSRANEPAKPKQQKYSVAGGLGFVPYGNSITTQQFRTGTTTKTKTRDKQYGGGPSGGSFSKAFSDARKAGRSTFSWNGKSYTTQMKGETRPGAKKTTTTRKATTKPSSNRTSTRPGGGSGQSSRPSGTSTGRSTSGSYGGSSSRTGRMSGTGK